MVPDGLSAMLYERVAERQQAIYYIVIPIYLLTCPQDDTGMETSSKTAREIYQEVRDNPARKRFGFGNKAVLVNIDPQKAYTLPDLVASSY